MSINVENFNSIRRFCHNHHTTLVAVSKIKPPADILALFELGQRDFAENYVQELVEKQQQLPADIRWHFIGHLQRNKVKYIAPFVHLIHGVDSFNLLKEINKEGAKNSRQIDVLLQMYLAQEETKFGMDEQELDGLMNHPELAQLTHIRIVGIMGMASFVEDEQQIKSEFLLAKKTYDRYALLQNERIAIQHLSLGMSADYELAIACGSNMVRIGSKLFGARV